MSSYLEKYSPIPAPGDPSIMKPPPTPPDSPTRPVLSPHTSTPPSPQSLRLTAQEHDAAFMQFKAFIRGLEIRDPERAEAIRTLYTALWKREMLVCLKFGEVRGRESKISDEVYGNEEEKRKKCAVKGKRYLLFEYDDMNGAGNTQGIEMRKPRPLNTNDKLVGCAWGAKMYFLLDRDVGKRRGGEEWLRRWMGGEEFRGLGEEGVESRLEAWRLQRDKEGGTVKAGVKRKAAIISRTGSVREKERTEGRERKRVRILLRTGSELEWEREAATTKEINSNREAKEEFSFPPKLDSSSDSSSDSEPEDEQDSERTEKGIR